MKTSFLIMAAAMTTMPIVASAAAPMTASAYVAKAGASDKYEIESSKLVMGSSNAKLKSFAEMMVTDHTKSTADVVAATKADGMTRGAPKLTAKQAAMIVDLKKVLGAERDSLYTTQQTAAHGDKAHLMATAGKIVPGVQQHLSEVKGMTAM